MSESTNYFISQLGEPAISQRDYKINEGGTKTFWFKVFLMLILKGTSVTGCVLLGSPSWFPSLNIAAEYGRSQASLKEQTPETLYCLCSCPLGLGHSSLINYVCETPGIFLPNALPAWRRRKRRIFFWVENWEKIKIRRTTFCLECPQQRPQEVAEPTESR